MIGPRGQGILVGLLVLAAARAEAGEAFGRDGILVRVSGLQRSVEGDFDGTSVFTDSSIEADPGPGWDGETFTVPELDSGAGVALDVGLRTLPWTLSVGASHSSHAGRWESLREDAWMRTIHGALRYAVRPQWRLHPELAFGLDLSRIQVDAGAQSDTDVGEATYKGLGVCLGGALVAHLTPSVSVTGDLAYRWAWYDRIEGVFGVDRKLVDARSADGWEFRLAAGFVVWGIPWDRS